MTMTIVNIENSYRDGNGSINWTHCITLCPEDDPINVCVSSHPVNGTPALIYHGREIVLGEIADGTADTTAIRKYLEGEQAQALLQEIVDGYELGWDGRNHVGRLTGEAREALESIQDSIRSLVARLPEYWTVEDWFRDGSVDEITAEMTDDQVAEMADHEIASALTQSVHLDADEVSEYITEQRDKMRDAAE